MTEDEDLYENKAVLDLLRILAALINQQGVEVEISNVENFQTPHGRLRAALEAKFYEYDEHFDTTLASIALEALEDAGAIVLLRSTASELWNGQPFFAIDGWQTVEHKTPTGSFRTTCGTYQPQTAVYVDALSEDQ